MNAASGELFVVSAPSGTGKTTLVKALVAAVPRLRLSVSHTTRLKRPGEVDGVDYHFTDETYFRNAVETKAFIEYAEVFGCLYGTMRDQVEGNLQNGIDVLLEIDWQGAHQVRKSLDCVSIFILPPSFEALAQRLACRGDPDDQKREARLKQARSDVLQYRYFDYLVFNDNFERALTDLKHIVYARRLRFHRQEKNSRQQLDTLVSPLS